MDLRLGHVAGATGFRDHLTATYDVALAHQDLARIGVGGDKVIAMAHQHEVAIAFDLAAGKDHETILGGPDVGPLRDGDADAVALLSAGQRAEAGDNTTANR